MDMNKLARLYFDEDISELTDRERMVLNKIASKRRVSRNINKQSDETMPFGDKLADKVAQFGGSWSFIIIFGVVLVAWTGLNSVLFYTRSSAPDPYPFIFLNLILSMLAAIQAPIIMMSQNRQSDKDRLAASHDYEVNLKAELEILQLHEKVDHLRQTQLSELFQTQKEQLDRIEATFKSTKA